MRIAEILIQPARRPTTAPWSRAFLTIGILSLTSRPIPDRIARILAETRWRLRPNASISLNIRISTEDEINGTVKWVG